MGNCSKCDAVIKENVEACWNCGEPKNMHINEPNGEAKNEAYVPRKIKKHRGCTLIAVVAVIILLVLELYPMFEVRFFGGFPSLSTALEMTKEPYYSLAKPFVDFMIVMISWRLPPWLAEYLKINRFL